MGQNSVKLTILGCGSSSGVPQINSGWGECDPGNPKNRRRRSSVLVQSTNTNLLVDCSPDCRQQLLDTEIRALAAILFTHAHADHCHGIDDLRWINIAMKADLPAYGDAQHLEILREKFAYAFEPMREDLPGIYYKPMLVPQAIAGAFEIGDITVRPFEQDHGFSTTLGFRFGDIAYTTDAVRLDETAFQALEGVKTWVVDCFRREPHRTHSWLDTTLEWIERVRPERAVLTHMGNDLDYDELNRETPEHVEAAYDGMVLEGNL
jgi:phosphoribosyl 1,2-cyclic phosphate phosphodiesterase